jgi:hypothetical protein
MGVGQPMGSLALVAVAREPTAAINGLCSVGTLFFALLSFCIPLASNLNLATSTMLFCSVHGVAASFE